MVTRLICLNASFEGKQLQEHFFVDSQVKNSSLAQLVLKVFLDYKESWWREVFGKYVRKDLEDRPLQSIPGCLEAPVGSAVAPPVDLAQDSSTQAVVHTASLETLLASNATINLKLDNIMKKVDALPRDVSGEVSAATSTALNNLHDVMAMKLEAVAAAIGGLAEVVRTELGVVLQAVTGEVSALAAALATTTAVTIRFVVLSLRRLRMESIYARTSISKLWLPTWLLSKQKF
ncbi:unnamed protein product [Phytophthora lilii]|uniref:Unnamed protein product n=1 Tax=Phytophthora lilii TaxID=2077276 RepID=A0A9W6TE07_9STRA|nr:unnamed protein product [Phytophthora lilii]